MNIGSNSIDAGNTATPETTLDRVTRLGAELAEALGDHDRGAWNAIVHPRGHVAAGLMLGSLAAAEGSRANGDKERLHALLNAEDKIDSAISLAIALTMMGGDLCQSDRRVGNAISALAFKLEDLLADARDEIGTSRGGEVMS